MLFFFFSQSCSCLFIWSIKDLSQIKHICRHTSHVRRSATFARVCALAMASDAPKCMCNLRFRWWCRRVCKYVSGICYHGNRHSVSRCNGMAGALLLERSSFHSDSASQLPMQEFLCECVCVSFYEYGVNPVWIWVFISVPWYVWLTL